MKRHRDLYARVRSFDNLLEAAYRARRGKRLRPDVAAFHYHLERNVLGLREELGDHSYRPGPYHSFRIGDPKPRLISAAPYRDRVVHHALCQVIEPIFERTFIHDSYANRAGKGTHRALDRCTYWARRHAYVLKCDIAKFFPSIDHGILLSLVERKLKCPETLWLVRLIVGNSNPQEQALAYFPGDDVFTPFERARGIPIGNLTSQFLANVYLSPFDHYVHESLRWPGYVRYCDDFLVFDSDASRLHGVRDGMQSYLNRLRLRLHARKCQILPTRCGIPFLGWQVFPDHRRLLPGPRRRVSARLRGRLLDHAAGRIPTERLSACVASCVGHLRHGDTSGLRRKLLARAPMPA